ncbi:arsenate reductase (glutaredoxin) [Paenimyroides aestuarii]|uniref:Arsenate reductase (Glutaredoxin) n=1 Tax=Paenimyroides aestuarii TaxID=2968490 RepID=A0ABY5NQ39_9FLAO|nr:arsenate reductase (glutaredoxin) [Paenimyroides aestuarii]UUV20679.1 arsenate reductase (glutaredoxin) [Paenimyroides aestuarii]
MIKIFHNPKCSKSREGLCTLQDLGKEVEIVQYIKNPLSFNEIKALLKVLKIDAIDLVRTKEAVWKEHFKGKELTSDAIIQAMVDFPQLIERPIVVNGNKAVIARPAEKIKEVL